MLLYGGVKVGDTCGREIKKKKGLTIVKTYWDGKYSRAPLVMTTRSTALVEKPHNYSGICPSTLQRRGDGK